MFNFIYAVGAAQGMSLTPAQIKRITKRIFNTGKDLSEELVKQEIKQITA